MRLRLVAALFVLLASPDPTLFAADPPGESTKVAAANRALIDACRAVGVPARFVGTPLWADKSGNHSWVEIWDDGWHFTGAAEPTGDKLDQSWFIERASTAQRDHPFHAIYATSFRRTPLAFPLVWDRSIDYVHAVNVTDRYAGKAANQGATIDALDKYLAIARSARPPLVAQPFARQPLTKAEAEAAGQRLWSDKASQIRAERAQEMESRLLTIGDLEMPFAYQVFGAAPKDGRSLYISLHGGGGAPKQVNDQQWENQKRLYQPAEGGYVAPRAPTNAWDLWHQAHIDRFFERLIENLIVFENVNPDRVYLMGYSAGGDGVYQVAPRMADRLAAAAMMAGHLVMATIEDQTVKLESPHVERVRVLWSDRFVDLDRPVRVMVGDKTVFEGTIQRTIAAIAQSLGERADPRSVYVATTEAPLRSKAAP